MGAQARLNLIKLWSSLGALGLFLILVASLLPQEEGFPPIPNLDKFLHILVYLIASWYFHQTTLNRFPFKTGLALFAYSGTMEVLQYFTEARSAEAGDLLANLVGIALGFLFSKNLTPNFLLKIDLFLVRLKTRLFSGS